MKEKTIGLLSLTTLIILGILALALALSGQSASWKFLLAFYPLLVILVGVALLRQSGLTMAFVGLALSIVLAVFQFNTPIEVALGASAYGFVKSFGISISVAATMLMIFIMREAGALGTVSKVIKQQVVGNEVQALYVGIGFGSFLTSLGVVTPALFPPLLIAMGFSPISAIAIAVLGYDPTTSFSLLSIPITLPAQVGGLNPIEFAFKVAIFLPLVSTGFAFAILWLIGGKKSMRKGAVPAVVCGLVLALACLGTVSVDYFTGTEYIPLRIVGVIAGLSAMISLYIYQKLRPPTESVSLYKTLSNGFLAEAAVYGVLIMISIVGGLTQTLWWFFPGCIFSLILIGTIFEHQLRRNVNTTKKPKNADYPKIMEILRSFSPWLILALLAATVSIPQIDGWLKNILRNFEIITIFANQRIDLDIFSQIYTWIFVAILLSLFTLKPTRKQVKTSVIFWLKRFLGPFLAYSLYFSIAFVMAFSAMQIVNGILTPVTANNMQNMNVILGTTLASVFGAGYIFVAASLGLFGAIVGGSETSSNVLFLNIQKTAAQDIGLSSSGFMTVYGSHAVAGGIASAVTPAKINNAVVTIDETKGIESLIMRKHLIVAILLTIATGILTGIFVSLGI